MAMVGQFYKLNTKEKVGRELNLNEFEDIICGSNIVGAGDYFPDFYGDDFSAGRFYYTIPEIEKAFMFYQNEVKELRALLQEQSKVLNTVEYLTHPKRDEIDGVLYAEKDHMEQGEKCSFLVLNLIGLFKGAQKLYGEDFYTEASLMLEIRND